MLFTHRIDFFAGAVFCRVRHGMAAIAIGLHFQDQRALAAAAMSQRLFGGFLDRDHVHAVDRNALDPVGETAGVQIRGLGRTLDRGAHAVLVVFDHVDHRQVPDRRHVEAFVDLALVDRAVAEIGHADAAVALVLVSEGQARTERYLGADDAVTAEEILFAREHVHGPALTLGIAAATTGQFGHHALGIHAAGQHVAVIAVRGNDRVLRLRRGLHADDDRFLADIEVTEPTDQPHAVQLAGLFLEPADQQHLAIVLLQLVRRWAGFGRFRGGRFSRRFRRRLGCAGHWRPPLGACFQPQGPPKAQPFRNLPGTAVHRRIQGMISQIQAEKQYRSATLLYY